ncbi:MAG TPA: hypothetical protein PKN26_00435 [Giesbergeria sp.]|nr:hypothetical protein [Giesbergeria sp.]HNE71925.1 hypothetical protein [Giesbergeria sp.]HNI75639.1 hypothetical protein [Giesbergeria sp.]HNK06874.1 hypothetical protein [Giesbergeria sp.]HNN16142.1 hypothetical protein [Giesbergeria sp.]
MKRIKREALPADAARYLVKRQKSAIQKYVNGTLDTTADWKCARQTQSMGKVLSTLHAMVGERQRCMYCLDSHGSDIDHFRPKNRYHKYMYRWENMLLCCTHCGRIKGDQFPMAGRRVLLVDPTKENPWDSLDFDPTTGSICARFDVQLDKWSLKGEKTVEVLHLDKREALSKGYLKTLRRLSETIRSELASGVINAVNLTEKLKSEDDHGLLGWCFSDRGRTLEPFSELQAQHPGVWAQCAKALKA